MVKHVIIATLMLIYYTTMPKIGIAQTYSIHRPPLNGFVHFDPMASGEVMRVINPSFMAKVISDSSHIYSSKAGKVVFVLTENNLTTIGIIYSNFAIAYFDLKNVRLKVREIVDSNFLIGKLPYSEDEHKFVCYLKIQDTTGIVWKEKFLNYLR
jgi:hypothetical protein